MGKVTCVTAIFLLLTFCFPILGQSLDETTVLTRENWGTTVGFAPKLDQPGYSPGMTIDKSNVDQFAEIIPDTARVLINKYNMVINTVDYTPYAPSDGYIAATNKFHRKVSLKDIGDSTSTREIEGYEGGMPFPAPKNGREISWNYMVSYGGDDGESVFEVMWISPKRGVERSEIWKTTSMHRAKYRTDIPPLPTVPVLAKQGIIAATLTEALSPADKKGYASLYYGYLDPKEPNGWLYLPPQRRTMRLTFGTRGESWNNTDLLYEDVRGYTGSPEWMNWNLVKKTTMLLPIHAGAPQGKGKAGEVYDLENRPHFNPRLNWELRPCYVVEVTPKLKGYPYSKMTFYIDAESSYILAKTAYDRKGNLWKLLINATNDSPDPKKLPPHVGASLVVDTQSDHATAFSWHSQKSNIGIKGEIFALSTLRKLGK